MSQTLHDFQKYKGKYIDMSGYGIKYFGTAIGGASQALIVPSSDATAPGVLLGNGLWGVGLGKETYGYSQLGKYNKMWTNILLGAAMKSVPKRYKIIQKKLK